MLSLSKGTDWTIISVTTCNQGSKHLIQMVLLLEEALLEG